MPIATTTTPTIAELRERLDRAAARWRRPGSSRSPGRDVRRRHALL
jgi:hypothetical protein